MKSLLRVLIVVSCIPVAAACDDVRIRYFGVVNPTPLVVVARPLVNPFSIFRTDLTIVRVSAFKSCAVIFTPGQIFPGQQWRVNMGSGSIFLQQDITNTPNLQPSFSGTLNGFDFIASSSNVGNVLLPSCIFRSSNLKGHFSRDFRTFDATELLTWGSPGAETTIERNWVGAAVADQ
jgi:hypothetical protein